MPGGRLLAVLVGGGWFMLMECGGGGRSMLIDSGVLAGEFETVGISMQRARFLLAKRSISGSNNSGEAFPAVRVCMHYLYPAQVTHPA